MIRSISLLLARRHDMHIPDTVYIVHVYMCTFRVSTFTTAMSNTCPACGYTGGVVKTMAMLFSGKRDAKEVDRETFDHLRQIQDQAESESRQAAAIEARRARSDKYIEPTVTAASRRKARCFTASRDPQAARPSPSPSLHPSELPAMLPKITPIGGILVVARPRRHR